MVTATFDFGIDGIATKRCSRCGVVKALEDFHTDRSRPDSRRYVCRDCQRGHARAHYQANRDAELARRRAYYQANRDADLERNRAWWEANPNKAAAKRRRDGARRRGAIVHHVTLEDEDRILERYDYRCAYCAIPLALVELHWDHVWPVRYGGAHAAGNLVPACAECNLSKHASAVAEWFPRRYAQLIEERGYGTP